MAGSYAFDAEIQWSSDRTIRIAWRGDDVSASGPDAEAWTLAAYEALRGLPLRGVQDVTPAYHTVVVRFDADVIADTDDAAIVEDMVRTAIAGLNVGRDGPDADPSSERPPLRERIVRIPVCYGGEEFGPDLASVASWSGLSADEVVSRHHNARYRVRFLGFSPGFGYLSGLVAEIAAPRLETPRLRVAAGSVGIAGLQTGVYPVATPGGWRIIGRTPLRMFDAAREEPSLLRPGDSVEFVPIPREEFGEREREAWGRA